MIKVFINGKFVDIDKAKISIFDRGFLYGDGVFETMRSYAGVIFKIDAHLSRLSGALKALGIKAPYSKQQFKDIIYKSLRANNLKSAYIRISITRGEGRFGIGYTDLSEPNIVIIVKEFKDYPKWMYASGLRAKIVDTRQNEFSPISTIKSLSFLGYILARLHARREGHDEAILMNTRGYIAEAATSNIFIVKRASLITPSINSGILSGITRAVVVNIARKLKIRIKEKLVKCRELLSADEVFLTNSLAEILPVTRIDSKRIGSEVPGEITKLLHVSYQKEVITETLKAVRTD